MNREPWWATVHGVTKKGNKLYYQFPRKQLISPKILNLAIKNEDYFVSSSTVKKMNLKYRIGR